MIKCGLDDCSRPDEFCEQCVRADERERIAKIMDLRAEIASKHARALDHKMYNEFSYAFGAAARIIRDSRTQVVIPKGSLNLPLPPGYSGN